MQPCELPLLLHSCVGEASAQALFEGTSASHPTDALASVQHIITGDFIGALRLPSSASLLHVDTAAGGSGAGEEAAVSSQTSAAEAFFGAVRARAAEAVRSHAQDGDGAALATMLCAGVAALHVFLQHNLTGPTEPAAPPVLSLHAGAQDVAAAAAAALLPAALLGEERPDPDADWVTAALQVDGDEIAGHVPQLQYLLLAVVLLVEPLEQLGSSGAASAAAPAPQAAGAASHQLDATFPTWSWWALRATSAHQHVLAGRAATLLRRISELSRRLLAWALCGAVEDRVLAVLFMELAQAQHQYGYVDAAKHLLEQAGQRLGLTVALSGALGRRTIHQVDAKAQLTVVADRAAVPAGAAAAGVSSSVEADVDVRLLHLGLRIGSSNDASATTAAAAADPDSAAAGASGVAVVAAAAAGPASVEKDLEGLTADSEVYVSPQLVDAAAASSYNGAEQALLLAWSTQIRKGSAHDELQGWQIAAYAEAVLTQPRSQYMLQAAAVLHKVRHERNRPRTRERSLLAMELLVEALRGVTPAANSESGAQAESRALSRVPLAASVWFPLQLQLRKELAEHYVAMGFVGAALKQYEALQLWDSLIVCYRLLDKRAAADSLIRNRIKVFPNDPKLWCALGDLHLDDAHYVTAWERSGKRHARAQRSLGHSGMRRKDYPAAAGHYELALALNPLNAQAWFALGYCRMKREDMRGALKAFSQVTQQEPENGEAWNNCAALWLQLGHADRAFSAQAEALRSKRDSWQAWENYAQAALGSGHLMQCARGLKQVLDLSNGQRLKADILTGLMDKLDPPATPPPTPAAAAAASAQQEAPGSDGASPAAAGSAPDAAASTSAAASGSGAAAAAEEEDDDDLAGLVFNLHLQLSPDVAAPSGGGGGGDGDEEAAAGEGEQPSGEAMGRTGIKAVAAGDEVHDERRRGQLMAAVGSLLKDAVNSPACGPALWGCLGRYYGLQGELDSQKEALLKQVRALQGSSAFKVEEDKFMELLDASRHLTLAYIRIHERTADAAAAATAAAAAATSTTGEVGGSTTAASAVAVPPAAAAGAGGVGAARELNAARLHLRGFLKASEPNFGEHAAHTGLAQLLQDVEDRLAAIPRC